MIFFKDLHSHCSFFLWLAGKKQKKDFVAVFASCSFSSLEIIVCVKPSPETSPNSWRSQITDGKRILLKIILWPWPRILWFTVQGGEAFFHLSCPHSHIASEEKLNASRARVCIALPLPSPGDLRAHGRGGLPGSEVVREKGGEVSSNLTKSLQQRLHPQFLLVVLICAAL